MAVGAWAEDEDSTLIVNGSTAPNIDGSADSGAVYIYTRSGTIWTQQAYIKAYNSESLDYFGRSIDLFEDTLVVGAPGESEASSVIVNGTTAPETNGAAASGAVYVYKRTGSSWEQEAYIKSSNSGASDEFGSSVSVFGDTLVAMPFSTFCLIFGVTNTSLTLQS